MVLFQLNASVVVGSSTSVVEGDGGTHFVDPILTQVVVATEVVGAPVLTKVKECLNSV